MLTDQGIELTKDVLFTSASAAASILSGTSRNGRLVWNAADGRTLKELEEAESKAAPSVALTVDEVME